MERVKINLNQYVYVKMSEEDFETWDYFYNSPNKTKGMPNKPSIDDYKKREENGYVKMQLHTYMRVFGGDKISWGKRMGCGGNLFFDPADFEKVS